MCEYELVLERAGRRYGHRDPTHAEPDQGADHQQLEADGAAGGAGELGERQSDPAQRAEQDIRHGGEPQPRLIGAHGGSRGAIGEQHEVLHRAFVGAAAVPVADVGEPLDLGRHAGQAVELGGGEQPGAGCDLDRKLVGWVGSIGHGSPPVFLTIDKICYQE